MSNVYMPVRSRICKIIPHTATDYTFVMEYAGDVKPGQFFEVSIPKYGEAPISVSHIGENFVGLTIRRVGVVTNTIHNMKPGDALFVRGPYGNGFDLDLFRGQEIIVAAGGTGLAPVKGLVDYFSRHLSEVKSLTLLAGFKSPGDILFKEDLKSWQSVIPVTVTVDRSDDPAYRGRTGLITGCVKDVNISNIAGVQVIVVGPPLMMKFTVDEFLRRGVREENIWVSYERKMGCGVGKCGHCKMDDTYICLEGPVFNYAKAQKMFD
ncbi:MAG TPA: anaerobic sulfite reductase subunit AsrB [Methylomusa anaerophila]|uniref:Anaerobic sulfite reductase subunit B n=1 Tax=Methylomusa anaerophila TaxID=1930071 RepID=A0A348AI43_9FIRM|nr:anaerobic sulfite reductase subunit AsrB [Methylomusa anaerophila]BBB90741.1 anaerobic sulfite reductase subunit B [Methylomusa anaerophila]HML88656.1 anaerobic sulfite reductase subunit AsrB [Methylomusa anaerophila]